MKARERIIRAFEHEEADRVPTFLQSMMPNFVEECMERWEEDIQEEDILYLGKDFTMYLKLGLDSGWGSALRTTYQDPEIEKVHPLPKLEPKKSVDYRGRIVEKGEMLGHVQSWYVGSYLNSVEEAKEWWETYVKPPKIPVDGAVEQTNKMLRSAGSALWDRFVPVAGMPGLIEPLMEGLGIKLFSRMLRKNKDTLHKFMSWMTRDAVEHAKIAVETDYMVFNLADDSAYKNSPMLNPKIHRELVIPYYKQICDVVRKAGKFIFFHSDGFTEPYFPGLIEAGFSGVESLEPMAGMDLKHLKEEYGDALCLIGNIDVSQTLPLGTPKDVAKEVKDCINAAAEGGGYILSPCTDLTDSVPLDNAIAMVEATKKYGKYT